MKIEMIAHRMKTTVPNRWRFQIFAQVEWQPEWVLAVDGSHQEEPVRNGYPGAEIGYVTIAAVLMDIAKIKELDSQRPINPKLVPGNGEGWID